MSILLTDKHVERCVTLLALMQTATNPVELQRFQGRHAELLREHPELHQIRDDDPRVEASLVELREAFKRTDPAIPRSTTDDDLSGVFDYV